MRLTMSFKSKRELLNQVIPRYRESNRKQKNLLLDEFIASTGYSRKYAIRLLSSKKVFHINMSKRNKPHYYDVEVQ